MSFACWLMVISLAVPVATHAQANSWTNSSGGKWEDAAAWDSGLPASATAALITNAGSVTVTIDATTVSSAPGSLTISNLLLSAPGVATNTLSISGAGATPLRVQFAFTNAVGGALFITNSTVYVNVPADGRTNILDGLTTISAGGSYIGTNAATILGSTNGAAGRVEIRGGTMLCADLVIGGTNAAGRIGIVQGLLTTTNIGFAVGRFGRGELTVSNSTVRSRALTFGVGIGASSSGTLTLVNSTNTLASLWLVASTVNSTGSVWVTVGSVLTNTSSVNVGFQGVGTLDVSNSTIFVRGLTVASQATSRGTATSIGSSVTSDGLSVIGLSANATGSMTIVGGQLNVITNVFTIGQAGVGTLTATNCTVQAGNCNVGTSGRGTLTLLDANTTILSNAVIGPSGTGTVLVAGGTVNVFSGLLMGDCVSNGVGQVTLTSGILAVTNAAHTAVLDVRSGTLTINGGTLLVDKLVMTNACGHFVRTGGALSITSTNLGAGLDADGDGLPNDWEQMFGFNPLSSVGAGEANLDNDGDGFTNLQEFQAGTDPTDSASALRIVSVVRTNNNMFISWSTGPGRTNALQASGSGSYSTNGFSDIFTVTNTVGTATNYLDIGAVTNAPSRYYRVRLVP